MFSYLLLVARVRKDHPLRGHPHDGRRSFLRALSPQFDRMYASEGRPSIAPEKLLRAQLLQMLYSVRSERLLMEEIDYSVLFRWFVGLNLDEEDGTQRCSPRTGTGCWRPRWRSSSWRRWWSRRG